MLKQDILYALEQRKGELVSGGALASEFGVTRMAVSKAIKALIEDGNLITAHPNSGYVLSPESDGLNERSIAARLTTRFLGRKLELHKSLSSTNKHMREMDLASAPDGLTVIADGQTQGRGRQGRLFLSPQRQGVYMSVLLKPGISPAKTRFLTVCAAVAVSRALEAVAGIDPQIKWVNDICLNGKKLCGILTEAIVSAEAHSIDSAIIGIGINTGDIPAEIADVAVSVPGVGGRRGLRNALIAGILNQLEAIYEPYTKTEDPSPVLADYSKRLQNLGQFVQVRDGTRVLEGTVHAVDETGALLLLAGGKTIPVISGEIM